MFSITGVKARLWNVLRIAALILNFWSQIDWSCWQNTPRPGDAKHYKWSVNEDSAKTEINSNMTNHALRHFRLMTLMIRNWIIWFILRVTSTKLAFPARINNVLWLMRSGIGLAMLRKLTQPMQNKTVINSLFVVRPLFSMSFCRSRERLEWKRNSSQFQKHVLQSFSFFSTASIVRHVCRPNHRVLSIAIKD